MKPRLALLAIHLLFLQAARTQKCQLQINPNCVCGGSGEISEGISNRIIGGIESTPHEFPWIVAIFKKNNLHCGGVLINDRFVLTAGHCVRWTKQSDLSIGLGMHDIGNLDEGYIALIAEVILHEGFESNYIRDINDIALIRLWYPIGFEENIQPVCLPHKDSDYTGRDVKITGWGRVASRGNLSRVLRQTTVNIITWAECRNSSFGRYLTESMMCAYNAGNDACQGDSGGPLLNERIDGRHEVIGIISWGLGCAHRGVPGVYVKITDYLDWIKYHSRHGVYCIDE